MVTSMDATFLTQACSSFLGALGFALFFNVRLRRILPAAVGGLITWLLYWVLFQLMGQIFAPCVIACIFAATYADVIARVKQVPTAVLFIISVIPLVPGRSLFYMMSGAVNGNWDAFALDSATTFLFVAGIAAGICIESAVVQTWKYGRRRLAAHRSRQQG